MNPPHLTTAEYLISLYMDVQFSIESGWWCLPLPGEGLPTERVPVLAQCEPLTRLGRVQLVELELRRRNWQAADKYADRMVPAGTWGIEALTVPVERRITMLGHIIGQIDSTAPSFSAGGDFVIDQVPADPPAFRPEEVGLPTTIDRIESRIEELHGKIGEVFDWVKQIRSNQDYLCNGVHKLLYSDNTRDVPIAAEKNTFQCPACCSYNPYGNANCWKCGYRFPKDRAEKTQS